MSDIRNPSPDDLSAEAVTNPSVEAIGGESGLANPPVAGGPPGQGSERQPGVWSPDNGLVNPPVSFAFSESATEQGHDQGDDHEEGEVPPLTGGKRRPARPTTAKRPRTRKSTRTRKSSRTKK